MILRSILGIAVLTAVLWLFSSNKKAINWWMVVKGLGLQFIPSLGRPQSSWRELGF